MSRIVKVAVAAAAAGMVACVHAAAARPADKPVMEEAAIQALSGEQLTEKREFKTKKNYTLLYRLHAPKTLEKGVKYPLVLFLHGAGERGNDNTKTLVHGVVPISKYAMKHGDAFVVAPQCPENKKWVNQDWSEQKMKRPEAISDELAAALALVEDLCATQPVDRDRIYVTGISMGGFGTWDAVTRRPRMFAAAMPICGGVDESTATRYRGIALRFFHGSDDGAVSVEYSRRMDKALTAAGVKHEYTEYPGVNHDCWTQTYANDEILAWLFGQSRGRK